MDLQQNEGDLRIPMPANFGSAHESARLRAGVAGGGFSAAAAMGGAAAAAAGGIASPATASEETEESERGEASGRVRYRECCKNHAASIGCHAVDGCGEFMPGGEEGGLKCAACGCHRNFHRREVDGETPHVCGLCRTARAGLHHTHNMAALALPPVMALGSRDPGDDPPVLPSSSSSKKRFRTKFTLDQKQKMFAFAERLNWRIQKQDEASVQQFCAETNVKRHVLKVWMHNNKNTFGKKNLPPSPSPSPPPLP